MVTASRPRPQRDLPRPRDQPAGEEREILGLAHPHPRAVVLGRGHQPDAAVDAGVEPVERVDHEQRPGHAAPARTVELAQQLVTEPRRARPGPERRCARDRRAGAARAPPGPAPAGAGRRRRAGRRAARRSAPPGGRAGRPGSAPRGSAPGDAPAGTASTGAGRPARTGRRRRRTRCTPSTGSSPWSSRSSKPVRSGSTASQVARRESGPALRLSAAARNGPASSSTRHCSSPARPGHQSRHTWVPAVCRIIRRPAGPIRSKCSCIAR